MTTDRYQNLNVVALGGGAAGAAITGGLARWIAPRNLFVVANTANDFEHLGLSISPDVDALMYALAGVSDPETGHGRA
ncbi:MAG: hypothetical protein ACE5G8_01800, partial [Anaerolineae bacterium]